MEWWIGGAERRRVGGLRKGKEGVRRRGGEINRRRGRGKEGREEESRVDGLVRWRGGGQEADMMERVEEEGGDGGRLGGVGEEER